MAVVVVLCAIWGVNQVAIKFGNTGISPLWQAALRSAGGAILVLLWARFRGIPIFERDGTLAGGIAAGLLFGTEFGLLYWAIEFTTAARSVVLLYTAPISLAIAAHFFLKGDRLTPRKILGLTACFLGVALLFADSLTLPDRKGLIGDALAFAASLFWSASTIVIKRSNLATARGEKIGLYQYAVSAVLLGTVALLMGERGIFDPTPLAIGALAFQVVIVVFVSYTIWFALVPVYRASSLASFSFLTPVFGVFAAHLLLGEELKPVLVMSLALVGFGIWTVNRPAKA
ncbi:MAG: EamA family transporter [Tagaea sp. CACIAM 22H2]|nr:EamA family transporter [Tagaea sp. CACIAM 22H2]